MSATEVFKDECWAGLAARLLGVATGPAPVNVLVVECKQTPKESLWAKIKGQF